MSTRSFDPDPSGDDFNEAGRAALQAARKPALFIVSPVRLHREGLAWSLGLRDDVVVLGSAALGDTTPADLQDRGATVVLLDTTAPGGLALARQISRVVPPIKVIAIAVTDSDQELLNNAEAGVSGYVTQDGSLEDLVSAVTRALNGEVFCSPRLASLLFQRVATLSESRAAPEEPSSLTRREQQVASLLAKGRSNKEIAGDLRIGPATVKNHVHNILEKLQVRRRGEAAARWYAGPSGRDTFEAHDRT